MIDYAIAQHSIELITAHIQTASQGGQTLDGLRRFLHSPDHSIDVGQKAVIIAAAGGKNGWFKTVGHMEHVACDIIAPNFGALTPVLQQQINGLFIWAQTRHG